MTALQEAALRASFETALAGLRAERCGTGATLIAFDPTGKFAGMVAIITSERMAQFLMDQLSAHPGVGHKEVDPPPLIAPRPMTFKRGGEA